MIKLTCARTDKPLYVDPARVTAVKGAGSETFFGVPNSTSIHTAETLYSVREAPEVVVDLLTAARATKPAFAVLVTTTLSPSGDTLDYEHAAVHTAVVEFPTAAGAEECVRLITTNPTPHDLGARGIKFRRSATLLFKPEDS